VALADAPEADELPRREYDTWFTTGSWATEAESASAFDRLMEELALFRIYREVAGTLCQPRPGQVDRSLRIDRVLAPTPRLVEKGWRHGAIGVEIKRSGTNIGPPLAQAMDYIRGTWSLGGIWVQLNGVFLWPMHTQGGPLGSVMAQQRIGSVSHERSDLIKFAFGHEVVIALNSYSGVRIPTRASAGAKVGSR
jgi:hypothetical protein